MQRFLDEAREEGLWDSPGGFTLSPLGALRRTLVSALPEPHLYLALIGQALVAAGASRIEVSIGRHQTRFRFDDTAGFFADLERARERLFSGLTLASTHPWDLLLGGLATAVGWEMQRAELQIAYGQQSLELTWDQAWLVDRPSPTPPRRSQIRLERAVGKGLSFAWTRMWGARREEEELQRRFEFASPPLTIAGLPTQPGSHWRNWVPKTPRGKMVLVEATVLDPDAPNHRGPDWPLEPLSPESSLPWVAKRQAFRASGERIALEPEAEVWSQRRWTFLGLASPEREAQIGWIRSGMVVEHSYADLGLPGLLVLAPADGLDVDVSGFALVRNSKFSERVAQAGVLARRTLGSLTASELMVDEAVRARLGSSGEEALSWYPWLATEP